MPCKLEQAQVQSILYGSEWVIRPVRTLTETVRSLARCHSPLVICETRFPDGDWRDLLAHLSSLDNISNLVLVAEHDVALAAELVNLGGYDVLEKPLDRSECLHVFASARRNWYARMHFTTYAALMPLSSAWLDGPVSLGKSSGKPALVGPRSPDSPRERGSFAGTSDRCNDRVWATSE